MGENKAEILILDPGDDVPHLSAALRFHGFSTQIVTNTNDLWDSIREGWRDLIALAVNLPDGNGIELCRELRISGLDLGLVLIGTSRCSSADKVAGLAYCDDYVTRPYLVDEVVARIRAVLRRLRHDRRYPIDVIGRGPRLPPADTVQRYADVELEARTFRARRAGRTFDVSPTEFRLLSYFLAHPHRVLSREEILASVWGRDFVGEPTIVDTYVSYLRRKLHALGPPLIHTRRGFGYLLQLPDGCSVLCRGVAQVR